MGALPHDSRRGEEREVILIPRAGAWGHVCENVVTPVARPAVSGGGVTCHVVCSWVPVEPMQVTGKDVDILEDVDATNLRSKRPQIRAGYR